MLRQRRRPTTMLARHRPACKGSSQGSNTRREANMAETAFSAAETALENQRIGGLQIRVAALCTLVQICDGYDLNSVAWAVPSLIHAWHLPPPAFTIAFLWSSIGILVGALVRRTDRRPLRPPAAAAGSLTIFGIASLAHRFGRLAWHAEPLALLHRARHRRRIFRGRRVDRRLRTASAARDDDHGDVHRRARRVASSAARSWRCCSRISTGR